MEARKSVLRATYYDSRNEKIKITLTVHLLEFYSAVLGLPHVYQYCLILDGLTYCIVQKFDGVTNLTNFQQLSKFFFLTFSL